MPVKKKKPATKALKKRQLTLSERKALTERLYGYINLIDSLIEKKAIDVQVKVDLKKLRKSISSSTPYLRRF